METKLREGDFSTGVCVPFCHSAQGRVGTSHASWDRSYGALGPLDIRSPRDLFKLVHLKHI